MRAGPSSLRRGTHTGPPSAVTQHAAEMTAGGQSSGDNGRAEAKASPLPSGVPGGKTILTRLLSAVRAVLRAHGGQSRLTSARRLRRRARNAPALALMRQLGLTLPSETVALA
jgi:hypothetical protein